MASVMVRGSASAAATPDEATVAVELAELRATAEEAYSEVAERSAVLAAVLDGIGVDKARRSSGGVSVGEHVEYVDGRQQHRGFRATARTSLRLDDPAVVARVLREAVAEAGARVDGPTWVVRPDNAAHLDAARAAAAAARAKAEAYAEALGVRLGALERVAEPGLGPPEPRPFVRALAAEAAPVEIGVEPGELLVSASIEVTYALEQP
jgi:uncharacterized protein